MPKCQYPGCSHESDKTWALVKLCDGHYQDIKEETDRYYHGVGAKHISSWERLYFRQIEHLMPWNRKVNRI